MTIDPADPLAVAVTEAIQTGDLERLRRLLADHPGLATARLGDDGPGGTTPWPTPAPSASGGPPTGWSSTGP